MRGRAAESSCPHGGQAGWGDFEGDGRGRSERPGGVVEVDEVGHVWGGEVVNGLEGMEEDLIIYAVFG